MDRLKLLCRIRAHYVELGRVQQGYARLLDHFACKLDRCATLQYQLSRLQTPSMLSIDACSKYNLDAAALLVSGLAAPCSTQHCQVPHLPMDKILITQDSINRYLQQLGSQRGTLLPRQTANIYTSILRGLAIVVEELRVDWNQQYTEAKSTTWNSKLKTSVADINALYTSVWRL